MLGPRLSTWEVAALLPVMIVLFLSWFGADNGRGGGTRKGNVSKLNITAKDQDAVNPTENGAF